MMIKEAFLLAILTILLASCSLTYEKEENPESSTPEFTFKNMVFTRTERNKKKMFLTAEKLEQYKSDTTSFAKNVVFSTFDENEVDETNGSCEFIFASTIDENYILLGDIKLNMTSQDMKIEAESLKVDNKNEQITSGVYEQVKITRNDIDMIGNGFSASGVSNTFNFAKDVSGTIKTEDSDENKQNSIKSE